MISVWKEAFIMSLAKAKKMGRCLQRIMSGYTIVMHRTFCEYHSEKSLIFY